MTRLEEEYRMTICFDGNCKLPKKGDLIVLHHRMVPKGKKYKKPYEMKIRATSVTIQTVVDESGRPSYFETQINGTVISEWRRA